MSMFKKPADDLLNSLSPELQDAVKKLKANQDLWLNQVSIEMGLKSAATPDRQTYLLSQQNWIIIHQLNEIGNKLDKLIEK